MRRPPPAGAVIRTMRHVRPSPPRSRSPRAAPIRTAANTIRTASLARSPAEAETASPMRSNRTRTTRAGASQPSWSASWVCPSVGSPPRRNGNAVRIATPIAVPRCNARARQRSAPRRRATTTTIQSTRATPHVDLISVPSTSATVAASSRREATKAIAAAIESATNASLCPLPAVWNRTAGLSANAATANAATPGRTRRQVRAISAAAPNTESTASARNAATTAAGPSNTRVSTDREHREHRSVHGGGASPLTPHQREERIGAHLGGRHDVRVRVMERGDPSVQRVAVHVAGVQQRHRQDHDAPDHGEHERRAQGEFTAPRHPRHEAEPHHDERDREDARHHRRRVVRGDAPSERGAHQGGERTGPGIAGGQRRLERRTGRRAHEGHRRDPREPGRDRRPCRPSSHLGDRSSRVFRHSARDPGEATVRTARSGAPTEQVIRT